MFDVLFLKEYVISARPHLRGFSLYIVIKKVFETFQRIVARPHFHYVS